MTNETSTLEKRTAEAPNGVERLSTRKTFMPRTDIYETPESVVVIADMPGVNEKSVDITLEQNVLTIVGTVTPVDPAGHGLSYAEYEIGDYQRVFTLSDDVDQEGISAVVKQGVLRLTLPKTVPAKAKKIAVKTA